MVSPSREQEILDACLKVFIKELNPRKIYLFGSRAKKTAARGADFDFAVDIERPSETKERKIKNLLEPLLGLHELDLIYLTEVDESFKQHVVKTGELVYER